MYELKQIMRQADCKLFAELLNRMREGNQTSSDISTLKQHMISSDEKGYPYQHTHLFTTNASVNAFNSEIMLRAKTPIRRIRAKDTVIGSAPLAMKKKISENFQTSKQVRQLLNVLEVTENVCYDLTLNLDTSDGLINGASCTVMNIQVTCDTLEVFASGIIWVKFCDPQIGRALRNQNRKFYKKRNNERMDTN